MSKRGRHLVLWWGIFIGSLLPFVFLLYRLLTRQLGPDPAQELAEVLGTDALVFLLLTLTVTPLKIWFGVSLIRFRRQLGLFCFFYACLHVAVYLFLLADWSAFLEDLIKRPYITVGALAFIILGALALTSPKAMVRRLGKRWKPLQRLIYPAAILVIVHFLWQARADLGEPIAYAFVLSLLFLARWKRLNWRR